MTTTRQTLHDEARAIVDTIDQGKAGHVANAAARMIETLLARLASPAEADGERIEGWAQWFDGEMWGFEVTDDPSLAQVPATLVLHHDDVEQGRGDPVPNGGRTTRTVPPLKTPSKAATAFEPQPSPIGGTFHARGRVSRPVSRPSEGR